MNTLPDLSSGAAWLKNEARSAHHRAKMAYAAHEDDLAMRLFDHADNLWRMLREVNAIADLERLQGKITA